MTLGWSDEIVAERDARMALPAPPKGLMDTLKKKRKRQPRGMNKTEQQYDAHLSLMERLGEVKRHKFEGLTLKLADDCRLTPDFVVEMPDGRIELHDTKICYRGKTTPHIEDDALVKLKVAAQAFPFKVKAVWPLANGEWDFREFSR